MLLTDMLTNSDQRHYSRIAFTSTHRYEIAFTSTHRYEIAFISTHRYEIAFTSIQILLTNRAQK